MAGEEERISWETKIKGWKGDSEGRVRKWGTARIDCGSDKKRRAPCVFRSVRDRQAAIFSGSSSYPASQPRPSTNVTARKLAKYTSGHPCMPRAAT